MARAARKKGQDPLESRGEEEALAAFVRISIEKIE
jgi:hypothetical protein